MNIRCVALLIALLLAASVSAAEPVKYARFQKGDMVAYGVVEGDNVRQLTGDLFGRYTVTNTSYPLRDVKLLPPTQPTQVLALAGNYRSHLQNEVVPPKFQIVQPFFKSPSCLVGQGDAIVIPQDAKTVHYEAELVVVIGKRCSKVSKAQALDYVFGVTAGNDVSERIWQNDPEVKDIQWWRAKGSDTFRMVCVQNSCEPFSARRNSRVSCVPVGLSSTLVSVADRGPVIFPFHAPDQSCG